jgi:hypothetical protein
VVYLGWTISTLMALTIIYSLAIPHQPNYVYNLVGSAFYAGFHRLGWSAVLVWIVFACINKHGGKCKLNIINLEINNSFKTFKFFSAGMVDKMLSWHLLIPMSRLTYSAFLVHFIPMIFDFGTSRSMSQYSDFDAVNICNCNYYNI